jgi:hypothetical protein
MEQNGETNQEISDEDSEDTGEYTLIFDIQEDDLDHQQEVLHVCLARQDNSLGATRVPLPTKRNRADTVIVRPLHPISGNLPTAMTPPLFKRQRSSLPNKLSVSYCTPSTRALVLPNKSSGDQNSPQPKASSDQNIPQH